MEKSVKGTLIRKNFLKDVEVDLKRVMTPKNVLQGSIISSFVGFTRIKKFFTLNHDTESFTKVVLQRPEDIFLRNSR